MNHRGPSPSNRGSGLDIRIKSRRDFFSSWKFQLLFGKQRFETLTERKLRRQILKRPGGGSPSPSEPDPRLADEPTDPRTIIFQPLASACSTSILFNRSWSSPCAIARLRTIVREYQASLAAGRSYFMRSCGSNRWQSTIGDQPRQAVQVFAKYRATTGRVPSRSLVEK